MALISRIAAAEDAARRTRVEGVEVVDVGAGLCGAERRLTREPASSVPLRPMKNTSVSGDSCA